jgi:hypothetical protein
MIIRAPSHLRIIAAAVGALGVLFILAILIWIMYEYTQPPPIEGARWAERRQNLADLNAQARAQLDNYAWRDQARAVVRLPVDRALELTAREWQDPRAGRAQLLTLLARAVPPVPATNAPVPSQTTLSTNSPPTNSAAPASPQ